MSDRIAGAKTFESTIRRYDPDYVMPAAESPEPIVADLPLAELDPDGYLGAARDLGFLDLAAFEREMKPPKAIIDGLLYANGVVAIYGKPGIGKSYLVLDLGLSIAAGLKDFHGRRLRMSGRVALLLFEGEYAIPRRIAAWRLAHGKTPAPTEFLVRFDLAKLHDVEATRRLAAELKALDVDVVIVDTLGAATAGIDEDRAKDMGPVVESCRSLARDIDGVCLLVAHPPKGNSNTIRGSNVLEANTDGVIAVLADDDGLVVQAQKVRAGAAAPPLRLRFRTIEIGQDPTDPTELLKESVLEPAPRGTDDFDVVLDDLGQGKSSLKTADLVRELVERGVCKKSKAYDLVRKRLPEERGVDVHFRTYTRGARSISISDSALS